MTTAVEVEQITRVFESRRRRSNRVVALDEVTLAIPEGEIHGLLGPNGAPLAAPTIRTCGPCVRLH